MLYELLTLDETRFSLVGDELGLIWRGDENDERAPLSKVFADYIEANGRRGKAIEHIRTWS